MGKINKARHLGKGAKASIAFFIASLVTSGISYIVTPVYTRLLTSEEYGQTSVFLTWLQIFGIISMFCLSYGVFNNLMSDNPENRDDCSFSMLILSNIITISFFGILLSLYPLVSTFLKLDIKYVFLMFGLCLFQPAYNFWATRQRYEYKYKMVLLWSIVCAILSPAVAIVLIVLADDGSRLFARLFGAECALICIYIGFYLLIAFRNKWKLNTKYWKTALLFNLPLIPHYLSIYLLGSSDKLMISYLVGDSATAYYSVAHSIAAVALIIWGAINSSLIPYTYEKCKEGKFSDINKVTLPLITLFAVGCVFVIMLAPEAVKIMATDEYLEAIYVIPPIVGGVFFQVQYYVYANIVYFYKKPVFVMIGSITAVTLNIILNYFCIKQWGYMAAGYTTILCYAVQAVVDFLAMRIIARSSVYNVKFIFVLSIVVIVIALTSNLIYDYIFIRLGILLLLLILAFIFRKRIISILLFRKESEIEKSQCE